MTRQIAVAQYPISSFSTMEQWKSHIADWVSDACLQGAEILIFPEYGSMELVSLLDLHIQQDLQLQLEEVQRFLPTFKDAFTELASKFNCLIIAPSFPEKQNNLFINRSYVFAPSGKIGYQDKLFMTRFEEEDWKISPADPVLHVFEWRGLLFGIQICFDSEFAFGGHILAQQGAQLIVAPSCTETLRGAHRVHIGCRARALEQQLFVCVAQTVGEAPWSPAVDINTGFGGFYATPDLDFPSDGVLKVGAINQPQWLVEQLDFSKLALVRKDGAVRNFDKHQLIYTDLRTESVEVKKLLLD